MSTENGSLNLKQRFLYREEICMMNYLEHHTPWENSEDKSEHIISMSFILCTFGAHIYICLHPLNKGKQGSSIARFVIISVLERNLSKHVSPGICNALYFSPYTGIPYPYWTNTQSNIIGYRGNKPWHQEAELLLSQVQNVEFTHPSAGCSGKDRREQDDRGIWTEQPSIPQIDLANTVANEWSALPQRPPCPPTNQGMESDMTNTDFPRRIYFPNTSEVLSQISNQTAAAVCI